LFLFIHDLALSELVHFAAHQIKGFPHHVGNLDTAITRLSAPVWGFIVADDGYTFVANDDFDDCDLVVAKMAEMLRTMFVPPVRGIDFLSN